MITDGQGVELAIRLTVNDGIHRFYSLVDTGRAASTAAMFASDARLTFGPGSPQPGTIEGAAIASAMAAREKLVSAFTRHSISNIMLEPAGEDRAGVETGDWAGDKVRARYLMVLFRSDDETRSSVPAFVADVEELWLIEDGTWRIAERLVSPAFSR